jgi:hypothetical protein
VHHRNRPGSPLECPLETLAVYPVADTIGQISNDAGIVDVTNGRVVQAAQRFPFAHEPGPGGLIGVEIHSQTHPALEDQVLRFEEHSLRRGRYGALQPVARPERGVGALEIAVRLG